MEEASIVFELEDPTSDVMFNDAKSQFQLTTLDRQLKAWRESVPELVDVGTESLVLLFLSTNSYIGVINHITASSTLYLHSIAIRSYERNRKTGKVDDLINSAAHFDALRICLEACYTVIKQYLSFDVMVARCLPDFYLLWTVYAAVMLVRLSHFVETSPATIRQPEESTAHLLWSLVARLAELSKDGYWPQARDFGVLFDNIRVWFLYKRSVCKPGDPVCNLVDSCPSVETDFLTLKIGGSKEPVSTCTKDTAMEQQGGLNSGDDAGTLGIASHTMSDDIINWDTVRFDVNDLNAFDMDMQNDGWMNYLYTQPTVTGDDWYLNNNATGTRDVSQ